MEQIVYISSIPWSFSWHRQQEMMSYMADKGYKILYVEPVRKNNLRTNNLYKVNKNIWIIESRGLPYERCSMIINAINGNISFNDIRKATKKLGFDKYIIWFDRVHGINLKKITVDKYFLYDLVDEILAFGRLKNKSLLLSKENYVLQRCNLLLSSSQTLMKRKVLQSGRTGESVFIPNGVDVKRFSAFISSKTKKDNSNLLVGFIGTISKRSLNYELIFRLAELRPNWHFVFVGPGTDEDKKLLLRHHNIVVKDAVSGDKIPEVIRSFDAGIIPYIVDNDGMDYVFPRKACEYLACGKPVVSTPLKEVEALRPFVETAANAEDFIDKIEYCIGQYKCEDIIKFVSRFDWYNLMTKLISKLKNEGW